MSTMTNIVTIHPCNCISSISLSSIEDCLTHVIENHLKKNRQQNHCQKVQYINKQKPQTEWRKCNTCFRIKFNNTRERILFNWIGFQFWSFVYCIHIIIIYVLWAIECALTVCLSHTHSCAYEQKHKDSCVSNAILLLYI